MTTPEINNRGDFSRVLAETIAEIDGFAAREPAYWVWGNLQRQLHEIDKRKILPLGVRQVDKRTGAFQLSGDGV